MTRPGTDTASYRENGEGYMLTTAMMQWFWGHCLGDPGRELDPLAESLAGAGDALRAAFRVA